MKQKFKRTLIFSSVLSFLMLSGSVFMNANAEKEKPKKVPGAIIIGIPFGCDCTAPGSACYCVVDIPEKPPVE